MAWGYTNISFEIRPDREQAPEGQRQFIHINPSCHHSPFGCTWEIWDESTFDLKRRLKEIANEWLATENRLEWSMKTLEDQLK